MKIRSILIALSMVALAVPASSQEAPQTDGYPVEETATRQQLLEPAAEKKYGPSLLEEQGYIWFSRHFRRLGPDANGDNRDSNRINLYMPWDIGVEIRGFGQMFAPGVFYNMYAPLTADTTGLIYNDAYYEQFKDARDFTIDTIVSFWFKNPNAGTPLAGAKFYVFRSPSGMTDQQFFSSTAPTGYRTRGARFDRDNLPIVFEADIDPEGIDTTLNGDFINPLIMAFDPPLTFEAGTFAIPMIINDDGEALTQIGGANDIRDYQIMAGFWDRRQGTVQGYGPNNGWKNMGLTMFRPRGEFTTDRDTIFSTWRALVFGQAPNQIPAHITNWMNLTGTVDINAGVKYHFGREASSQGLGAPTPNPVTSVSRVPFSLTEISQVSIDLFDVNGNHVRQLVTARYVPGNYSIALPVDELNNGAYIVRMTAGQNVYSMKVNVAK